jgi:hypothetical protein
VHQDVERPYETALIALSREQLSILTELVDAAISTLRLEIARTERREYRKSLEHRLGVVEAIAGRLRQVATAATGRSRAQPA